MKQIAIILAAALLMCGCPERDASGVRDAADRMAHRTYTSMPASNEMPALRDAGRGHFRVAGCEACHSTSSDRKGLAGPPLGGVSARVLERFKGDALEGRRWLVKHIRDPHAFPSPNAGTDEYRGSFMPPNTRFEEKEFRELVEYLWGLP